MIGDTSHSSAALWTVNGLATFKDKKIKINISAHILDKLLLSLCLVHRNAQNPVGTSKIWWWLVSCRQQGKFSLQTKYHLIFSLIHTIDGGIHFTANTESEMMKAHLNCVHVSTATKDNVLEGTQSGSSGPSCSENTRHSKLLVCVLTQTIGVLVRPFYALVETSSLPLKSWPIIRCLPWCQHGTRTLQMLSH